MRRSPESLRRTRSTLLRSLSRATRGWGARFLIVRATSAAAVLSASTVSGVGSDPGAVVGLSAALAVIVGAVLVAAGAARLGS